MRGRRFEDGGEVSQDPRPVAQDRRSAAFMRNLRSTAPGTMEMGIMPIVRGPKK